MNPTTNPTMRILALVGPLASGKTTTAINTLKHITERDILQPHECAFLLNDEGGYLDGSLGEKYAQVVGITNGCFTCGDTTKLRAQLDTFARDGIKLVIMEGFGITGGDETVSFLKSTPYPFHVATTISHRYHQENISLHKARMASQVEASTLCVCVTKAEGVSFLSLAETPLAQFVGQHNRLQVPLIILQAGDSIPEAMITRVLTHISHASGKAKCGCGHTHLHTHSYQGDHAHKHATPGHHTAHGMYLYSLELKPGATIDQIEKAFNEKDLVIRVKGATAGNLFNMVHSEWQVTFEDKRSFITFYTSEPVVIEEYLPDLCELILPTGESFGSRESYTLNREESSSREELVSEIQRLLEQMPTEVITTTDSQGPGLVTHPEELQTVKEISRRPSVKDEWFPTVLNRCLKYWLQALDWLETNETTISPDRLATHKVELGVSIAWWVDMFGHQFDGELVQKAKGSSIGILVATGVLGMDKVQLEHEKAYWQCKEIVTVLRFGKANGDDVDILTGALKHGQKLARGTTMEKLWNESTLD